MSDESMDPCECLWNHELAMRRLLSLLRQAQSYCTDNECLEELPALPGARASDAGNSFLIMFLMMALAVALYVFRPQRAQQADLTKPTNPHDSDGAPPNPPAIN